MRFRQKVENWCGGGVGWGCGVSGRPVHAQRSRPLGSHSGSPAWSPGPTAPRPAGDAPAEDPGLPRGHGRDRPRPALPPAGSHEGAGLMTRPLGGGHLTQPAGSSAEGPEFPGSRAACTSLSSPDAFASWVFIPELMGCARGPVSSLWAVVLEVGDPRPTLPGPLIPASDSERAPWALSPPLPASAASLPGALTWHPLLPGYSGEGSPNSP